MTNLAISGFTNVSRTTSHFNAAQLNILAGNGVWVVTQAPSGEVYTRQAVTTAPYSDLMQREEMVTRNVDSISFLFMEKFAPYIGVANVTPSLINLLTYEVTSLVTVLKTANASTTAIRTIWTRCRLGIPAA